MPDEITLGQAVALEHGLEGKTLTRWTEMVRAAQKGALAKGLTKEHEPFEGQPQLTGENQRVQVNAEQFLTDAQEALGHLFNVTATKDWGNTLARAGVIVDGVILLPDAPVPYLLFVEKMLGELNAELRGLPTQPQTEDWQETGTRGLYKTATVRTPKMVKVEEIVVPIAPTEHQPGQWGKISRDVQQGWWAETKFTGALSPDRLNGILTRIAVLREAVVAARVRANLARVETQEPGELLLSWVFAAKLPGGATS